MSGAVIQTGPEFAGAVALLAAAIRGTPEFAGICPARSAFLVKPL